MRYVPSMPDPADDWERYNTRMLERTLDKYRDKLENLCFEHGVHEDDIRKTKPEDFGEDYDEVQDLVIWIKEIERELR